MQDLNTTNGAGAVSHPKWELSRWYMRRTERTAERPEAKAKAVKSAAASASKAVTAAAAAR